ncbi:helix-turn-helix domain-containing protein [Morganella morganii]|nr:helix-turn-helix transcriptional regulator [Morganella morganii]
MCRNVRNDLAIKIGVSQQQVSRYESGHTPMTINTVIMIAHVLHISVNELLSDYLASEYTDIMLLMSNRNTEK